MKTALMICRNAGRIGLTDFDQKRGYRVRKCKQPYMNVKETLKSLRR